MRTNLFLLLLGIGWVGSFVYSAYLWWVYIPHYTLWILLLIGLILTALTYLFGKTEFKP